MKMKICLLVTVLVASFTAVPTLGKFVKQSPCMSECLDSIMGKKKVKFVPEAKYQGCKRKCKEQKPKDINDRGKKKD